MSFEQRREAQSPLLIAHHSLLTMLYPVLISLIWGLFAAMLFLNLYIRVKAFKYYRLLVKARVEFGASHIFNRKKLEQEILPRYPAQRENILAFVNHIHRSLNMATVLMVLITLFGAVLMYYRKT